MKPMQRLAFAIKLMRQLVHTNFFDEFCGAEIAPGADVQSDEEIGAYIRNNCGIVWHPVGTCKIGTDLMAVGDCESSIAQIVHQ